MAFVVVVGIYLAGELPRGETRWIDVIPEITYAILPCGYLCVLFYYHRISCWMWFLIASVLVRPMARLVGMGDYLGLTQTLDDEPP